MKWGHLRFVDNKEWTNKCEVPCILTGTPKFNPEKRDDKDINIVLLHEYADTLKDVKNKYPQLLKNETKLALISTESLLYVLHNDNVKYGNNIFINKN
jgi:hypothetical protein